MNRRDQISSLTWLVIGLLILVGSLMTLEIGTPSQPGPGLFPFIIGCLVSLFSGGTLLLSMFSKEGGKSSVADLWKGLKWWKGAYTVMDRATFLTLQKEIKLAVLVEKDEALLNFISLIPVSPKKFPTVNYESAMLFVRWLTSPEKGQLLIRDFGKEKYGSPLFFPNSKEWKNSQGAKK